MPEGYIVLISVLFVATGVMIAVHCEREAKQMPEAVE